MNTRRALLVLALLTTVAPAQATAQWRRGASLSLSLGGATENGGEYDNRGKMMMGATLDAPVARAFHVLTVKLAAGYERYVMTGDKLAICRIGSRGQCLEDAPNFTGLIALASLQYEPVPGVRLEGGYGGGYYKAGRVGPAGSRALVARGKLVHALPFAALRGGATISQASGE